MSEKRYFTHKEGMTYTGMGDTSFSCLMSGAVIQDNVAVSDIMTA